MVAMVRQPAITMNSSITFPARPPALKLPRSSAALPTPEKWAVTLAEERRSLKEDHEALRVREENLRDYEARLRALQDEIERARPASAVPVRPAALVAPVARTPSRAPFESEAALQSAWEKFHRTRELFEAEQAHLRSERISTQEKENDMKRREKAVAEREARLAERERLVAEATAPVAAAQPIGAEHTMSAVTRLTRGPFDMARSVFGGKK